MERMETDMKIYTPQSLRTTDLCPQSEQVRIWKPSEKPMRMQ